MRVTGFRQRLRCALFGSGPAVLLLARGFLLLRSSSTIITEAFRPSTFLAESSLVERRDSDSTVGFGKDGLPSRRPKERWDGDDGDLLLLQGPGTDRQGFLRNVTGVGLGLLAAGISWEPQPAQALFEDVNKPGRCPPYKPVEDFDVDKYMGIWYELAYHDWTQIKICGCTRFNMTRTDAKIKDAFTTKCPYEADLGETFLINMRENINYATPGSFQEYAFYNKWDNKVVALWRSENAQGVERYERAIQMQCVEILGRRAFVGINFLSRAPFVSPEEMAGMFDKARSLGLAGIGGSPAEMEIVRHEGCMYPVSSGNREKRSWGSAWGVNTLAV